MPTLRGRKKHGGYMNKTRIWLPIVAVLVLLVLLGGMVYAFVYRPAEEIYASALAASSRAPYAEAKGILTFATRQLARNPFGAERATALNQQLDELLLAEADRAEAADDLAYAADLLGQRDPDRAKALRQTLADREAALAQAQALAQAYSEADILEQAGKDEEALAAFQALNEYEDAPQRVAAIQARLDYAAAKAVFTGTNFDEGIAALAVLGTAQAQADVETLQQQKVAWIEDRRQQYKAAAVDQLSAGAWHTAVAGDTPWIAGDGRYADAPAHADKVFSGPTSVFYLSGGQIYTTGETFGAEETLSSLMGVKKVAPGLIHALILQDNGHVTPVGSEALERLPKAEWDGMADVAAGAWHSVALRDNGTAVACGLNDHGQCDVDNWTDVVSISAGLWHTVGLKKDGTVVACGDDTYGQCDVAGWTDVVAISCGACTTVGLKADGTVVACGDNGAGQCDVAAWTDVAAVAAGSYHTVGLRLDGTVLTAGLAPAEIPETKVFASDWASPAVKDTPKAEAVATIYIQGEEDDFGPWLYMDTQGVAVICIDYSGDRELFRTDMLATKNALPSGRVTLPEASGNYIQMPSVLSEEQARNHHAVVAFTGDFIGWTSNRKAVMIRNGVVYYDRQETTTMALLPDGTMAFYAPEEIDAAQLQAMGVRDSFSFGPLLVKDGKVVYKDDGKDLATARVGFGYSDPFHYIAVVALRERQTALSFVRLSDIFVRFGARLAYNMDGGHSTSLVFMGKELSTVSTRGGGRYGNIRGLSDIVMFLENDAVGAEPEAEAAAEGANTP